MQHSLKNVGLQGDVEKIRKLLSTSARVLANTIDENRRRYPLARLQCPVGSTSLYGCISDLVRPLSIEHFLIGLTIALACSGLHFVCATGNMPCVQLFIKAGADLDLGDKDGVHSTCTCIGRVSQNLLSLSCPISFSTVSCA